MKKILVVLMIAALLASGMVVSAGPPAKGERGRKGRAGKSNVAFIELWEKDEDWDIVSDGAWGKMKYNLSGVEFEFVFNGHGLKAETEYTLIYYPEDWPTVLCLASATANEDGDVHIKDSVVTGDLEDAKIWLVPSSDVDCDDQEMTGWNPEDYLFEYDVINFEAD